jgi:hypothetical protein
MTKRTFAVLLVAASASLAAASYEGRAGADETATKPGTITLKTTTVVGSYRRPSAVIEVARAKPEIKLSDLADPAVEKIIRAASKAPF